jgi:hypothetical protein
VGLVATLLVVAALDGGAALAGCGGEKSDAPGDSGSQLDGAWLEASVDAGSQAQDAGDASTQGLSDAPADAPGETTGCVPLPPVFAPPPGTFNAPQAVTITTGTPGAKIYFTIDHTNPTQNSAVYTAPIDVNTMTEIRAIASAPGCQPSNVVSALYNIIITGGCQSSDIPQPSPPGEVQYNDFLVSLSTLNSGDFICYTLDGSTPYVSGTSCLSPAHLYDPSKKIPIDGTVTGNPAPGSVSLNALGSPLWVESCYMANQVYRLQVAPPTVAPPSGAIAVGATVSFTTATTGAVTFHYSTDGTQVTCASPTTGSSFVTTGTETSVHVVGCKAGYLDSLPTSASYTF